jgi:hypothetical protein
MSDRIHSSKIIIEDKDSTDQAAIVSKKQSKISQIKFFQELMT